MKKSLKDLWWYQLIIDIFFMLSSILTLLLIITVSFLPVIIWAYIFTYIDESRLSRRRLLSWVFAGALSVAPVLFMKDILSFIGIEGINIFSLFSSELSLYSWFPSFLSLLLFFSGFLFCSFLTQLFLRRKIIFSENYKGSIMVFLWGIIWILALFFITNYIPFLTSDMWNLLQVDGVILSSLSLVIGYYLVIALLEEWAKHFQFLSGATGSVSLRKGVLYSIFIALWFSFIENILYTYFLFVNNWFSSELLKLYFFRGVFSIILHILCTTILAYSSLRAFEFSLPKKTQIFIIWVIASIWLHALFDIALTMWFSFVLILYFIWGYLYVSSLFYSKEA